MIELSDSDHVAHFLKEKTANADVEEFWVLALNPQCKLIQARMLFRGTVDECFFHPRDVFRFALLQNASFLVVGHNHPSGNAQPSSQDIAITKKLAKLSRLLQIPVLDHVIILKDGSEYFSFKKKLLLEG